jgi:hypothetical protein
VSRWFRRSVPRRRDSHSAGTVGVAPPGEGSIDEEGSSPYSSSNSFQNESFRRGRLLFGRRTLDMQAASDLKEMTA